MNRIAKYKCEGCCQFVLCQPELIKHQGCQCSAAGDFPLWTLVTPSEAMAAEATIEQLKARNAILTDVLMEALEDSERTLRALRAALQEPPQ